jgi:hypothetical protein
MSSVSSDESEGLSELRTARAGTFGTTEFGDIGTAEIACASGSTLASRWSLATLEAAIECRRPERGCIH